MPNASAPFDPHAFRDPPDYEQAGALRSEAESSSWNGKDATPESMLAHFMGLAERGWSPYLHEYLGARSGRPNHPLFAGQDRHAGIFKAQCELFPATLEHWKLIPRTRQPAESALTTWTSLGAPQREWLLAEHGEQLLAAGSDEDAWIKCMGLALMPAFGAKAPDSAFHGYFDSKHWQSLRRAKPHQAWQLACHLCCLSSLPQYGAPSWRALAESHAAQIPAGERPALARYPDRLASACIHEHLRADRAPELLSIARAIRSAPQEGESRLFSQWKPASGELRDFMEKASSIPAFIRSRFGAKCSIEIKDAFSPQACSERNSVPGSDAADLPLFTLAAQFGASSCWDALAKEFGGPPQHSARAAHSARLPSLPSIAARLAKHGEAAIAAGNGNLDRLRSNMEREATRARRILSRMPLPDDLADALAGPGERVERDPAAAEAGFDEASRAEFARECSRALAKALQGKPASVKLPIEFTWGSMALAMRAKASFLAQKLPAGALSRAAAPFEAYHPRGIAEIMGPEECAWVERDELACASPKSPGSAEARRPRL